MLFCLKKYVKISLFKMHFQFFISGKFYLHLLSGSENYLQLQIFHFLLCFETFPGI